MAALPHQPPGYAERLPEFGSDAEHREVAIAVDAMHAAIASLDLPAIARLSTDGFRHVDSDGEELPLSVWFEAAKRRPDLLQSAIVTVFSVTIIDGWAMVKGYPADRSTMAQSDGVDAGSDIASQLWVRLMGNWKRAMVVPFPVLRPASKSVDVR